MTKCGKRQWLFRRCRALVAAPPRAALAAHHPGQAGAMGLTDVLLGVAVAAIALPTVVSITNRHTQDVQDQIAAQQLKAVSEAANAYIRNHFRDVYDAVGAGAGDFLSVDFLRTEGYLPASFSDTNAFGQDQAVLLRRVAENTGACATLPASGDCAALLEAVVVTTGGDALPLNRASHIASLAGQHGGMIVDGGTARGTYGGWCTNLALFGGATPTTCATTDTRNSQSDALTNAAFTAAYDAPAAGGLAAAMFFNGTDITADFLARVDTGNPEDNRMRTDLDMAGNSITNVATITDLTSIHFPHPGGNPAQDVTLDHADAAMLDALQRGPGTTCAPGQVIARRADNSGWECVNDRTMSALMLDSGDMVAKPTCPSTLPTPVIYTAVSAFADSSAGNLVASVQTWAVNSGANWTVNMRVRTESGWVTPPPTFGKILVLTGCV